MNKLRSFIKLLAPSYVKRGIQRLILGYDSFAPSFAFAGEDMILRHILGADKRDGFYVDVGAYHPSHGSNTYFFYRYGWQGINIEPRPGSKALFDKMRPRDINLEVGVSLTKGELTYYVIDETSTMNSFSKEFLESIGSSKLIRQELKVCVYPLADILESYLQQDRQIDFMSVDVEGHDLHVLKSNDWERFRPSILVIEDSCDDPQHSEIVSFMQSQGYTICAQNVIVLGHLTEYFFIEEDYKRHYWERRRADYTNV